MAKLRNIHHELLLRPGWYHGDPSGLYQIEPAIWGLTTFRTIHRADPQNWRRTTDFESFKMSHFRIICHLVSTYAVEDERLKTMVAVEDRTFN